jgi:putative ABC transport system permease protein
VKSLRQIALLLQMSIAAARGRLGSYFVAIISITSVVGVLVAMLSMGTGVQALAVRGARADRAMVETSGAIGEFVSSISPSAVGTIESLPGVKHGPDGEALATANSIVLATVERRRDDVFAALPLYAVDSHFFAVFPEVRVTAGRQFRPGLNELIVQSSRRSQFQGLEIGDRIHAHGVDWTIVGAYQTPGGSWDGLIGDLNTVTSAYRRNTRQLVTLVLQPPLATSFASIAAGLQADPTMDVEVHHEAQLLDQQSKPLRGVLNFVSYFVGVVMALGATLGAVNIFYSIVDARRREMATLRAIGFGAGSIAIAILLESLLVAIPSAMLGLLAAWLFFNGNQVSSAGISFQLVISEHLALLGVIWALVMGFVGGLLPALRSSRASVIVGLGAA